MKQTKTLRLFFVLAVLLFSSPTWAGRSYYKNLSFTVKNPETAKGIVYLAPCIKSDNNHCEVSKDPKVARVRVAHKQKRALNCGIPIFLYIRN